MSSRALSVSVSLAFVLEVVGLAGPGWIVETGQETSYYIGIWLSIVCNDDQCKVYGNYRSLTDTSTNSWLRYQILTTTGVGACLLTLIVLICTRNSTGRGKYGTAVILMCVSGGCSIAASAMLGKDLIEIVKVLHGDSPYKFPWALLLTGVGGIIAAVSVLIGIKSYCPSKAGNSGRHNQTNSVATGNQSAVNNYSGYNYNPGYAPPPGGYAPPMNNVTYGATNNDHLYPNLSPYGPNPSSPFTFSETPAKTPSAPLEPSAPPPPYEMT